MSCGSSLSSRTLIKCLYSFQKSIGYITDPLPDFYFRSVFSHVPLLRELFLVTPQMQIQCSPCGPMCTMHCDTPQVTGQVTFRLVRVSSFELRRTISWHNGGTRLESVQKECQREKNEEESFKEKGQAIPDSDTIVIQRLSAKASGKAQKYASWCQRIRAVPRVW